MASADKPLDESVGTLVSSQHDDMVDMKQHLSVHSKESAAPSSGTISTEEPSTPDSTREFNLHSFNDKRAGWGLTEQQDLTASKPQLEGWPNSLAQNVQAKSFEPRPPQPDGWPNSGPQIKGWPNSLAKAPADDKQVTAKDDGTDGWPTCGKCSGLVKAVPDDTVKPQGWPTCGHCSGLKAALPAEHEEAEKQPTMETQGWPTCGHCNGLAKAASDNKNKPDGWPTCGHCSGLKAELPTAIEEEEKQPTMETQGWPTCGHCNGLVKAASDKNNNNKPDGWPTCGHCSGLKAELPTENKEEKQPTVETQGWPTCGTCKTLIKARSASGHKNKPDGWPTCGHCNGLAAKETGTSSINDNGWQDSLAGAGGATPSNNASAKLGKPTSG